MSALLHCQHYAVGECRSCSWLPLEYTEQLTRKQAACADALAAVGDIAWDAPFRSALVAFRNKAKLAVGGSAQDPTLGLLDDTGQGIDLAQCLLYPPAISSALPALKQFIALARLQPYDLRHRRGELKFLLLTASPCGELMLRIVLRSREALPRIHKHRQQLQALLPALRVLSVNLQPLPAAVLEGPEEILLDGASLPLRINQHTLYLQPGGFFQTNSDVAAALYRSAAEWTDGLPVREVLDLYCGIGGFAVHLARPGRRVHGVEISPAAIESAQQTARTSAHAELQFRVGDAASGQLQELRHADLVVVNPPRRGLGDDLCKSVQASSAQWLLYSSCNPASLARDLACMSGFEVERGRLFDMFPHTAHSEVLLLLRRRAGGYA